MDLAVLGLVVVGVIVLAGLALRPRKREPEIVDDANSCAACGNTELTHPAEGVYVCRCGFRGGPGLGAYAWKLETERIAAMSDADRAALLARVRADAKLQLGAARGDFDMASRAFRAGESIVPIGRGEALRKTELYDQVREYLPSAERHLTDAVASVEKVRHIERGGGRMNEGYDKLKGSRESALTLTGMQATAALRAQLEEVGGMLVGLEQELGPTAP